MKPSSKATCFSRLSDAPNADALDRVWDSFSDSSKADPEVRTQYLIYKKRMAK